MNEGDEVMTIKITQTSKSFTSSQQKPFDTTFLSLLFKIAFISRYFMNLKTNIVAQ